MMSQANAGSNTPQVHVLRCMEIWSGNRSVENIAEAPGLEVWLSSHTYQGHSRGGDVYYLSLCAGGIVTRIALADVAGHGNAVAETSNTVRQLLRRFMNAKSQSRLVVELNRKFSELEQGGAFATAIVATYLSHKRRLLLTNAGHPRPLIFRKSMGQWQFLADDSVDGVQADNLPLGFDSQTSYQNSNLTVEAEDWIVLYTDAFTEATDSQGNLLGESGLIRLVEQIPLTTEVGQFGRQLLAAIEAYSQGALPGDDATLIVGRFGKDRRIPGIMERLRGYAEVIRSNLT